MSNATDMLTKYLDAESKVLKGLDVRFGERRLVMADLAEIRTGRVEWEARVATEQRVANGQRGGLVGYSVSNFNSVGQ